MSIPRIKCQNHKHTVSVFIFIPFVDNNIKVNKQDRVLFDKYVERTESCFFIDILGHCVCEDGVLLFVEFLCPKDFTKTKIQERLMNWKEYAPWLKKEFDEK